MKKIVILCLCVSMLTGKSVAQHNSYALSKLDLKTSMAMEAPKYYSKYVSGSKLGGVGCALTLGGAVVAIIGAATADREKVKTDTGSQVSLTGTEGVLYHVGIVGVMAGTPLWIIGSTKKKNARNAYLKQFGTGYNPPNATSPYLQLNIAHQGVGCSFVF